MYKSIQQTDSQRSDIFEIVNIFSTGVADIDNNSMIVHLETANRLIILQISQAQQIEVALTDPYIAEEVADKMSEDLKLSYFYITPGRGCTHPVLLQVNKQSKSINDVCSIFYRSWSCTWCRSLPFFNGHPKDSGNRYFESHWSFPCIDYFYFCMLKGGLLGTLGSCLGLAGGFFTIIYRKQVAELFGFWDATLYKLKEVPAYYELSDIAIIFIGSVLICTLASAIPAIIAASVNPVKALQSKG